MSKAIILGASGFVGAALIARLNQQSLPYIAPSSKTLDLTAADAPQKIADMVQDGDSILMLSAYTPEKGDATEMTIKNMRMVQHVLMGIKQRKIGHFVYISSDAVYALTSDIVNELTPPAPYSLYGHMHMMREQCLRDQIAPEKLTILRPCAIYGKGDTHNAYGINRFIRSAVEQGDIALFGGGEEYRDHVHVDDVAALIFTAWQKKISGTFNIASGKSWRFVEIAEAIQAQMDKKVTITFKPRSAPIFHRHVDISTLCSTFPAERPRSITLGITQLLKSGM